MYHIKKNGSEFPFPTRMGTSTLIFSLGKGLPHIKRWIYDLTKYRLDQWFSSFMAYQCLQEYLVKTQNLGPIPASARMAFIFLWSPQVLIHVGPCHWTLTLLRRRASLDRLLGEGVAVRLGICTGYTWHVIHWTDRQSLHGLLRSDAVQVVLNGSH